MHQNYSIIYQHLSFYPHTIFIFPLCKFYYLIYFLCHKSHSCSFWGKVIILTHIQKWCQLSSFLPHSYCLQYRQHFSLLCVFNIDCNFSATNTTNKSVSIKSQAPVFLAQFETLTLNLSLIWAVWHSSHNLSFFLTFCNPPTVHINFQTVNV